MAKKVRYCENHPDVVAIDSCAECNKRICYNCKVEAFGLVFCSAQCLLIYASHAFIKGIFGMAKAIVLGILWTFRRMGRPSLRGWVVSLLVAGLLVCFFFIWKLSRDVRFMEENGFRPDMTEGVTDTSRILPPKIVEPTEGGMVSATTVDIAGEAEENRVITLSIDGKLEQAILPDNGKFRFEDIRLRRGVNRLEIRAVAEDGRVSSLQTLMLTHATPTLDFLIKDFSRGSLNKKEIAVTFDGGSIDNAAGEILDILEEKDVRSTFFLTGEFIRKYPQTVKRIASEGHEVGNHTWSHPHLTSFAQNRKHITLPDITEQKIRTEFSRTASLFHLVTNQEMVPLWRAPFGEYNQEILRWAAKAGYRHVGWTVGRGWDETMDTLDWVVDKDSEAYRSAEEIVEKILNHGKGKTHGSNGAIILMHLGTHRQDDFPHRKLPEIIDGLRDEGYRLVKVTEMMMEE